jgi:c-di-GMP-binding flagellar brake protein YcgR
MKRRINSKLMLDDIGSGMNEVDLMVKHNLSPDGLLRLFRELVRAKKVTHQDLYKSFAWYQEKADQIKQRRARRASLSLRLPIYDILRRRYGILRDISVSGLRVAGAGIEYHVDDSTIFHLPTDHFMNMDSLLVVAECRWVSKKKQENKHFMAGFELTDLSPTDLRVLQRFINHVLLSKSGEWNILS